MLLLKYNVYVALKGKKYIHFFAETELSCGSHNSVTRLKQQLLHIYLIQFIMAKAISLPSLAEILTGNVMDKEGLNQLFRLRLKSQKQPYHRLQQARKLGQFHNILLGCKLCSCGRERRTWKQKCVQVGENPVLGYLYHV